MAPSSSFCKKHEVFISFKGEETCRAFTSQLHRALCLRGIETYIDNELPKGDDISESLIQAIQDSSLSVVVFSENYASSKRCLNELIQILRFEEQKGQLVVPVFYQVDPSHVRNQRGAYEKAFAQHRKNNNEDKVEQWRQALFKTANIAGWHSTNFRTESELIQNIVDDIMQNLNRRRSSTVLANVVGIDENLNQIESLLKKFSIIGIWGMSGIGKTTMAKVIFAKFRSQFDISYFLENLGEETEKHGLMYVRDKLYYEVLKYTSLERVGHTKVLIVLDDVSDTNQLDYLESEAHPLGCGSKIIITSRDRHILDGKVEKIHEAKTLSYDSAFKLFNLKAFPENGYRSEYKQVVERAVAYAQGIPLTLTVLGSFLHSKTIQEWDSVLSKIERTPHQDIQPFRKVTCNNLTTSCASSSSPLWVFAPRKYDVFVSYRGEDTRDSFTKHLRTALVQNSIVTFRDDEQLERGDEIAPSLIKAIENSNLSIIVFSKNYASSRWCLDEVAQIMHYRKHEGQFVIPIFYKVDPSHVRKLTGAYKEAFEKHEKDSKLDPHRMNKWKYALSKAAKLSGWHCQTFTDESNLIKEMVCDVDTNLELVYGSETYQSRKHARS